MSVVVGTIPSPGPSQLRLLALLALSMLLSCSIAGASFLTVPGEGSLSDEDMELVAENHLSAVEALYVPVPWVSASIWEDDEFLDGLFPTDEHTVRWVVDSYFKLLARQDAYEEWGRGIEYGLGLLVRTIDRGFHKIDREGTEFAWELRYNGSRVLLVSDALDDGMPEERWTVSHDCSGEVWAYGEVNVTYRASLRFHLWPTEGDG